MERKNRPPLKLGHVSEYVRRAAQARYVTDDPSPSPRDADLAALVKAAGDALGQLYLVGIENAALLAALEPFTKETPDD